jgi:hypothetical protein
MSRSRVGIDAFVVEECDKLGSREVTIVGNAAGTSGNVKTIHK